MALLLGMIGDKKPVAGIEDTAVAPERLADYMRRLDAIVRAHGAEAAYYGHASVGCIHVRPILDLKQDPEVETLRSLAAQVSDLVLEFGGAMSAEHGDGLSRSCWNEKLFGPILYSAFRELKAAFDPQRIMNPGRIVDAPPMTANLRYGGRYKARQVKSFFRFGREGGLRPGRRDVQRRGRLQEDAGGHHVPLLHGHARGGALHARPRQRAARGSERPPARRGPDVVQDVRGIRPLPGVQRVQGRVPVQRGHGQAEVRVSGPVLRRPRDAAAGPALRPCRAAQSPRLCLRAPVYLGDAEHAVRWALHALGIHRNRTLPPFARETFTRWFARRSGERPAPTRGPVVLFDDTYMRYNYPALGRAAVRVLEAAGFEVILADRKCCGRPLISKGLIRQAKENAAYNVDRLSRYAEQGIPIVGLEPSCILTFRDEYPELLDDPRAERLARGTFLIEEFLLGLHQTGRLGLPLRAGVTSVLLHGHCHQKALVGSSPSLQLLRLLPGARVEEVDSGCCGMAGSFGYEKEHYEMSLAIGERRLFPAIRAADPACEIVAAGVSCRQQIAHGTGRRAKHLVEVLAEALP